MRSTIRLRPVSGIDVGLHWSIVFIGVVLGTSLTGTILPAFAPGYPALTYLAAALVATVAFLGSIVAHELGHALVARKDGVRVEGITLFALGGVARLGSDPTTPASAARIALAGPAVSVALGLTGLGLALASFTLGLPALVGSALGWLGLVNLSLALFNLAPALPLDGGRVLQAWLWHRRGDRHGATISAARLGRWIGWALVGLGLWRLNQGDTAGLWTMMAGWFVIVTARAESVRARLARRQQRAAGRWPPPSLLHPLIRFAVAEGPGPRPGPGSGVGPGHGSDRAGFSPGGPGYSGPRFGASGVRGPIIEVDGHRVDPRR